MLESKVKSTCKKKLTAAGWLVIHLIQTNLNGINDTLILKDGRYVWIEFKRDDSTIVPKPLQDYRHTQLRKYGAEVYTVNFITDINHLL